MSDERHGATSASNAEADVRCPGRFLAQRGIAEPPRSADAAHGDVVHRALADSANPSFMNTLTMEQRETFDACREIEKKLVTQMFGSIPVRVWREQRYWVKIPRIAGGNNDL